MKGPQRRELGRRGSRKGSIIKKKKPCLVQGKGKGLATNSTLRTGNRISKAPRSAALRKTVRRGS